MSILGTKTFTLDHVVRIGITLLIIWGLIMLLGYLSDVLIPFVVALLLAYLINPLVCFIQNKVRVRIRVLSVIISLILVFGFFTVIGWLVLPAIGKELSHMGGLLNKLATDIHLREQATQYFPEGVVSSIEEFIVCYFYISHGISR